MSFGKSRFVGLLCLVVVLMTVLFLAYFPPNRRDQEIIIHPVAVKVPSTLTAYQFEIEADFIFNDGGVQKLVIILPANEVGRKKVIGLVGVLEPGPRVLEEPDDARSKQAE